jgi:hypothetical protein
LHLGTIRQVTELQSDARPIFHSLDSLDHLHIANLEFTSQYKRGFGSGVGQASAKL